MGQHVRHRTPEERAKIMVMRQQGSSVRRIAQALRRSPSTISRELSRYAAWSSSIDEPLSRYRKLALDPVLFDVVRHSLSER